MAPTRMKLRLRRRDTAAGGSNAAGGAAAGGGGGGGGGGGQAGEEENRSRERSSRSRNSRKKTSSAATAVASSSPPTSSASVHTAAAAEEASPDSKCPICLDRFNNLAYLDRCLHRFCFPCIQEWSHNKAECPLCKQPFASILHSVRAEDDFKEYTLRPAPGNGSVAATVAMVAAMASAARSDHEMRLMLRRRRTGNDGDTTTTAARRRRERGGRGGGAARAWERRRAGEWYLAPPLALPPLPHHPGFSPVADEEGEEEERGMTGGGAGEELGDRGVIFEGLTGLGSAVIPVTPNDRSSRRLMTRLAARRRLQREGGSVRRLRERETLAFRRALYRSGIRVRGVTGAGSNQGQQQRDVTAESYRRNPAHLNRLRPWLRRELTVLYGAHGSLVDIVQRIITARLARHGLEDAPTIEEELRPFLLARTEHFLHELVSFARSPLSLENYDLQAVYEPPAAAMELDAVSSSTDDDSVIAISEGEEGNAEGGGGTSQETAFGMEGGAHDDIIQTGSSLSLSVWDDETPGPSYSTAEPSHSSAPLSVSPVREEGANEEAEEGERREDKEEEEEECLIVGYVKPMAERTPELVQLSSDTEEEEQQEEEKKKEEEEKKEEVRTAEAPPPLPSIAPPLTSLPTIPPSTSSTDRLTDREKEAGRAGSRSRSLSGGSGRSSPSPGEREGRRARERRKEREKDGSLCLESTKRRSRKRRNRGQERGEAGRPRRRRSGEREGSGGRGLYNPNRSIYPAMLRRSEYRHSRSPSPFHSSSESHTLSPPSQPDSPWEYRHCRPSSLSSSSSPSSPSQSSSTSSSCCSSPPPLPPPPSLSPAVRGGTHHGDKPGGKRKYKSRHLDDDNDDPTWQPASGRRGDRRRERGGERERKRRAREGGRRRERGRRDAHRENSVYDGESSRRCREGRSPSVEIIYEGTVTSTTPRPSVHKRRRKRHRRALHSSSPVVITIDSDSSHDDINNSSSPFSSQQPVDFSDLPPLPLVNSGSVVRNLDDDISELPVDILERGSDRSETEMDRRSKAPDPVALDNSDNNSNDVENSEGVGRLLGRAGDQDSDSKAVISYNKASPASRHRPVEKPVATTATVGNRSFIDVSACRQAAVVDLCSQPMGEGDTGLAARNRSVLLGGERETETGPKDSGFANSDTHLLATILNDLKGISEPKGGLSFNADPKRSPNPRKHRLRGQCDVSQGCPSRDSWVAEEKRASGDLNPDLKPFSQRALQDDHLSKDRGCRQVVDSLSPTHHPSFPLPPPLQRLKEREAPEEARDVPPLLKHGNMGTLPPLKHKDALSPRLSPISPVELQSLPVDTQSPPLVPHSTPFNSDWDAAASFDSGSVTVVPPTDLQSTAAVSPIDSHRATELPVNDQPIPPILTLKRHLANTAASRGDRASTSSASTIDLHSSHHLAPIDSHSRAPAWSKSRVSTVGFHPIGHRTPTDSHFSGSGSRNRSTGADRLPPLDLLSFPPTELHSSGGAPPTVISKETPASSHGKSPIECHPVNSVSSTDFHSARAGCSKETPAHGSSTSRVSRKETAASCRLAPVNLHCTSQESPFDLHPSSGVSANETPASSDIFSGVGLNELSPPVCVSPVDTRSWNSSSPNDFHPSNEVANRERLSERHVSSRVSSVGKPGPDARLSPVDLDPKSHKFPSDLHSSSAASERQLEGETSSRLSCKDTSLHSRPPPIDLHCRSPPSPVDFLSSGAVATTDSHCNNTALSSSTIDHSTAFHTMHRESGSKSRITTDSHSKPHHPTGTRSQPQLPIDAHSKTSIPSDSQCESQLPVDSKRPRRDSSFCSHIDNHAASSPPPIEDQWKPHSATDVHSDTQSPTDELSAGQPDAASSIWKTHTHTVQLD